MVRVGQLQVPRLRRDQRDTRKIAQARSLRFSFTITPVVPLGEFAALAPRGDARAIARLLASAQEDAREGARADREAAAAARAASSDDAE